MMTGSVDLCNGTELRTEKLSSISKMSIFCCCVGLVDIMPRHCWTKTVREPEVS